MQAQAPEPVVITVEPAGKALRHLVVGSGLAHTRPVQNRWVHRGPQAVAGSADIGGHGPGHHRLNGWLGQQKRLVDPHRHHVTITLGVGSRSR